MYVLILNKNLQVVFLIIQLNDLFYLLLRLHLDLNGQYALLFFMSLTLHLR
jgi:hypothetical protein